MKTLKSRLLFSFLPPSVISILILSGSLWWVIESSNQQYNDQVYDLARDKVKEQASLSLRYLNSSFVDALFQLENRVDGIINRPDFLTYVEKSQPEPLYKAMKDFSLSEGMSFVFVVDSAGYVLSSYPKEVDELQLNNHLHGQDIDKSISEIFHISDSHVLPASYVKYDQYMQTLLNIQASGFESDFTYGPLFVKPIDDEFGDRLGYLIGGVLLDSDQAMITKQVGVNDVAFAALIDGKAVYQLGLQERFAELTSEERARLDSQDSLEIERTIAQQRYLFQCGKFDVHSEQHYVVHCSGLSTAAAEQTGLEMEALTSSALMKLEIIMFMIAGATLFLMVFVARFLSYKIATPLKVVTADMLALANNNPQPRLQKDTHIQEINQLEEAMGLFKTHIEKRFQAEAEKVEEMAHRLELEKELSHSHKLESLGTLAGGMAHELNNQLLPVMSMTELTLKSMPDNDKNRRKLELVLDSAYKAQNTVSKILAFSRSSQESSVLCDVTKACMDTQEFLQSAISANVKTSFDIQEAIGQAPINTDDLHGAIVNLFSNALDALDALDNNQGSIALTCEALSLDRASMVAGLQPGNYAKIAVRDTGHGMDSHTLENLFDPFYTTKEPGKGTGLGMSIVHTSVKKAGGAVTAESEVGKGSTVTIYLPLVQASS